MRVFILLYIIFVFILWPVALIWAINTIFDLGIIVTMKTWLAASVLIFVFSGHRISKK